MEHLEYLLKTFSSIFIIMGPFSIVPVFITLTKDNNEEEKSKMIQKAGFTVIGICLFFALFGNGFFQLFGFSIYSFKVAGGLLLLLMSIDMLHAKRSPIRQTEHEEQEGIEKNDVSIFPLAIPMISGPGAISTVVLLASEVNTIIKGAILFLSIIISTMLICLILKASHYLMDILGRTGINIITRLMGLILAAISIEYIIQGIKVSFGLH